MVDVRDDRDVTDVLAELGRVVLGGGGGLRGRSGLGGRRGVGDGRGGDEAAGRDCVFSFEFRSFDEFWVSLEVRRLMRDSRIPRERDRERPKGWSKKRIKRGLSRRDSKFSVSDERRKNGSARSRSSTEIVAINAVPIQARRDTLKSRFPPSMLSTGRLSP